MRAPILVLAVLGASSLRAFSSDADAGRLVSDLLVREFALCSDNRSLVVRDDAKVWLVDWPGGTARPPATESNLPPCAAVALGFSPDGRLFAQPKGDGSIAILEAATGTVRTTMTGHVGTIGAVVFSPDGKWLASGGFDNDIRIWDVAAGTCARTLTTPSHATFTLVWAPDGKTFYAGGASRTVTVWSAATGERLRESASLGRPVQNLAISADGRRLVAGTFTADGTRLPADIRVLDAQSFADQRVIPSPDGGTVGVAFSPDGRRVLWASTGGRGIMVTALEH